LLLGVASPAYAQGEPPQARVYRALDDSPYQIRFNRDIDFGLITRSIGEDDFYWDSGSDKFALLWDEGEFVAAVEQGETEFTMTGEYGLSDVSSTELIELWDAGLVMMPAPPKLLVHIRPRDYSTVYSIQDEEIVWEVQRSTSFEDAIRNHGIVTLRPTEGANPYQDPVSLDFLVTWNRAEYETGIESGAETFSVSGIYGEPDWDEMKGWAKAEGTAKAVVAVKGKPVEPLVYRDPAAGDLGGMACTAYVTPGARFDELRLPDEIMLRLVGGTYQDTRRFIYRWSREEFEKGLESGSDRFTVSGGYAPHPSWSAGEQRWWDEGLIRVDMPLPELTVHVLRDQEFSFTADVRINSYGDLGPYFAFPWVAGMEKAVLAYSLDNKTWHEESWTWDDLPSDQRQNGRFEYTLIAMDEDYNPMITEATAVIYVKVSVVGSPLAGDTKVFDLKPSGEGWDMTPHDDQGGDHGGGGQGESGRPGKEESDNQWDAVSKPKPGGSAPESVLVASGVREEQLAVSSVQKEAPASSSADTGKTDEAAGTIQTDQAYKEPRNSSSRSSEAKAGEQNPVPESVPDFPAGPASADVPSTPAFHIPGFATATAATAALALGAAIWSRRHKKRK